MSKRFTETDKWKNGWFIDLSKDSKLLFIYLFENCDIAGFISVSYKLINMLLEIDKEQIDKCFAELEKSIIKIENKIFIKNFIEYQKNYPLNENNKCHKGIISILDSNYNDFNTFYNNDLWGYQAPNKPLVRGIGIGNSKGIGKGIGKGKSKKKKKPDPKKIKKKCGEYQNVLLSEEEYNKLKTEWGESITKDMIKKLDEGIELKGYKYKSHYLALRKWREKELQQMTAEQKAEEQKKKAAEEWTAF